jgi:acyl-CoA synthetase (AMP-forming)/AMP-acid ligase II
MLLQNYLYQAAQSAPDKDVLIYGENRISYGQLISAAESIAQWIDSLDLEQGFRGALLTDDPLEYIAGYFGILIAGGVVVGLNSQTSTRSLQYHLDDCGASVLLAHKKYTRYFRPVLLNLESIQGLAVTGPDPDLSWTKGIGRADLTALLNRKESSFNLAARPFRSSCDLAQIIYTSGTTGKPKGVMLRHANLVANTESIVQYLGLTEQDRIMAVLPFFYSYGNSVMLTHIAAGGCLVVNQSFLYPNVILQQMADHEVTGFSGVPSTFALLLNRSSLAKFRFPALRYLTQAGAAMSPALAGRLEKHFPGVEIYIMYGQTEASARLTYLEPSELHNRPGSIGKGIPGVRLSLLDQNGNAVPVGQTGEIVVQGENVMAGYWEQPGESAKVLRQEGLWTGDLARQDENGFFYIISRKSDIIKSGSHRIGPKEIEDTLAEHPAVHEAAVIGVADEILDERIRACIVLKDGCVCVEKDLISHCRKVLPAYKVPQEIRFFNELPKTATGKIKKTDLKSL